MDPIATKLTEMLDIDYPIILAPMFLVSNKEMLIAASKAGISGAIPALNWRQIEDMRNDLLELKKQGTKAIGINLIVNKSNFQLQKQLQVCLDCEVDYIITSLGGPQAIIEKCQKKGIKVFCDVVNLEYAKKVEKLGADALIAVNSGAGGHAGQMPASVLIPQLKDNCSLPIISAGGVGTGQGLFSMLGLGAIGISMGSPFIASSEAHVSQEYKQAIVDYGADDIVFTTKLSGTPCTVINTDYVKKIGTKQNVVESFLNKNRKLKKYAKLLTGYKGMNMLKKAAFEATYKSVWCAGPSIEFVHQIRPIKQIVDEMITQYHQTKEDLCLPTSQSISQ